MKRMPNPKDRFDNNIIITPSCWLWVGAKVRGYGAMQINGKKKKAHRFSYEFYVGEIADSMLVCHKCDVPACVNPSHLFLGTHADNAKDKVRKKRQARGEKVARGRSKLTPEMVKEIRDAYKRGDKTRNTIALAKLYRISNCFVSEIINNKKWKEV